MKLPKGSVVVGTYVPRRAKNFLWELVRRGIFRSVSHAIRFILLKIIDGEIDFEGPDGVSLAEAVYGKKPTKRTDGMGEETGETVTSEKSRKGSRARVRLNTQEGMGDKR